ncbi:hypothetical protein [Clostridium sp. E02]|uniref:hypothetical protein n=1 Tax=Clostridium sp. E02 TaxID=2487134 RepID=UPI000F53310B|nr:hypothetical protein [Clostridium sp. E02]
MKILTIGGKDYKIEYSFEAAEYKECVDKAFKVVSGSYMIRNGNYNKDDKKAMMEMLIDGTSDMVSDLPAVVPSFLYAGLLENNPVADEQDAKVLFKQFIKENPDDDRASFYGMFEFLKQRMEEDGFFKLTGLDKLVEKMNQEVEPKSKSGKTPQDRKRKSTSTK